MALKYFSEFKSKALEQKEYILTAIFCCFLFCVCTNKEAVTRKEFLKNDSLVENETLIDSNQLTKKANSYIKAETCVTVVYEILQSSPQYKKIISGLTERVKQNGGTSYGLLLEGSPNPENDLALTVSYTYDISLHESYTGRMPVIARFTFDPKKEMLYKEDIEKEKLLPIDFDKKLLEKLHKLCDK